MRRYHPRDQQEVDAMLNRLRDAVTSEGIAMASPPFETKIRHVLARALGHRDFGWLRLTIASGIYPPSSRDPQSPDLVERRSRHLAHEISNAFPDLARTPDTVLQIARAARLIPDPRS